MSAADSTHFFATSQQWSARFWALVDRSFEKSDCWGWRGGSSRGYAVFCHVRANRIAWFFEYGDVLPKGKALEQTCDTPFCINPMHWCRFRSFEQRFWTLSEKQPGGCWLWQGDSHCGTGYGKAEYCGKTTVTHRISWMLAHGPIPDGMHVLHKCDVRMCVNPSHLFLGTNYDNVQDKIAKGRGRGARAGEQNHHAKLTACKVREIRQRYADGNVSQRKLGEEFGVCGTVIGDIINRTRWKHVD